MGVEVHASLFENLSCTCNSAIYVPSRVQYSDVIQSFFSFFAFGRLLDCNLCNLEIVKRFL